MLAEAKVTLIEENFEKNIREGIEKELKQQLGKEIKEKFGMEIREKVPEKYNETLEKIIKKIESLKKQASNEEAKIPLLPSQATIKPSTFDGSSSWQVYKTQFTMVAEANSWSPSAKAFHLAASLRGDAANVLETLSEAQRHNFDSLSSALELRFGEKGTKEYSRLQLKSRYQKAGESLQELATDIQRFFHLAFSDCPAETREDRALQPFIDSLQDPETQKC